MTNIFNFLEQKNIAYAVLKGVHDEASCENEKIGFKKDLDLVLNCKENDVVSLLKAEKNFRYLKENSFLDIENDLRIDLYFKTLNVGYYHFLKVDSNSFITKEVAKKEYVIYQILDPLLKFSKYHKRHQYRLTKYFSTGIPKDIEQCLSEVIGKKLASELLTNISNLQFDIRKKIIQKCKLRMLFINGNFVKMIKSRIF